MGFMYPVSRLCVGVLWVQGRRLSAFCSKLFITLTLKGLIFSGFWAQRPHYARLLGDVMLRVRVSESRSVQQTLVAPGSSDHHFTAGGTRLRVGV